MKRSRNLKCEESLFDFTAEKKSFDLILDSGIMIGEKISFNVPKGCVCGFIGQNGVGKTTALGCLVTVKAGSIWRLSYCML